MFYYASTVFLDINFELYIVESLVISFLYIFHWKTAGAVKDEGLLARFIGTANKVLAIYVVIIESISGGLYQPMIVGVLSGRDPKEVVFKDRLTPSDPNLAEMLLIFTGCFVILTAGPYYVHLWVKKRRQSQALTVRLSDGAQIRLGMHCVSKGDMIDPCMFFQSTTHQHARLLTDQMSLE